MLKSGLSTDLNIQARTIEDVDISTLKLEYGNGKEL